MKRTFSWWTPCAALALIQGCATVQTPPLEARWYFGLVRPPFGSVSPDGKPEGSKSSANPQAKPQDRPQVEIILLNRSSRRIEITQVYLNAYDETKTEAKAKAEAKTENKTETAPRVWVLNETIKLPPGGYRILATNLFTVDRVELSALSEDWFSNRCLLPVSMAVQVPEETRDWLQRTYRRFVGGDDDRVQVELLDHLPDSIPEQWRKACTSPRPAP